MRSCSRSRATSSSGGRRGLALARALVILLAGAGLPTGLHADDGEAANAEEVHLSREEALVRALPGATRLESAKITLPDERRAAIEKARSVRIPAIEHELVRGFDAEGAPVGFAMFVDEIGKFRPITFVVALTPKRTVRDVAVCVYRESHGGEITRRRFLKQFREKGVDDPLRLGREVIHISGATLSCRATIRAVERVLALVDALHDPEKGFDALRWSPLELPEVGALPAGPSARRLAMGTLLDVSIDAPPGRAEEGFAAVFAAVARVRSALDGRLPSSDIARILAAPPGSRVTVSAITVDALARAVAVAEASGGAFDPTLVEGGWRELAIDRAAGTVARSARVSTIDLGGIGKGIALDRAAAVLRTRGLSRALLNFGGQVLALDPPRGTDGWQIAIADPDDPARVIAVRRLANASLACSGTQHRGAHIVDPATGRPAAVPGLTAVTADDATAADAWSTACAVAPALSRERAVSFSGVRRVEHWDADATGPPAEIPVP